ncbi:MAG: sensor histidine kinase [Bacteroidota bacterium]
MRLATKINIFSALIFALLMTMVASLTQSYLERVFREQTERSLEVSAQGFRLAIQSLCEDQAAKARMQSQRDVLRFAAHEHFSSVLNYYLRLSQADLNVDCLEVLDHQGDLLADGRRYYDREENALPSPAKVIGAGNSFMARRERDLYLISAVPLDYLEERVGYVGAGKRLDRNYLAHLASMLHSEIVVLINGDYAAGTITGFTPPAQPIAALLPPGRSTFATGVHAGSATYDFVFVSMETGGLFHAAVGIGLDRRSMALTLARARVFLLVVSLAGLGLAWVGSYLLARNIKRAIYGMEPDEIAAVLNERNAILQSTFEGIIAVDRTGRITLVNQEAQKLLPKGAEVQGQKIGDLLPDPNVSRVLENGEAVYNQQHLLGETIVFYNIVPIVVHHEMTGAVITLRDFTEFQKVAAELMEIKSYTQALRSQSHEFMNKLHTVSGLIQLGRYDQALRQLHETVQSHQDLVTFLMRAFRSSTVSGILLGKFNRANELNIRFNLDRSSGLDPDSRVPETELVCIIGNIIENAFEALKASEQAEKQVWVKIRERRRQLSIMVVNNGPCIPRRLRARIFERGFTTKAGHNKGLGLALVAQCVSNLRGTIRVRSDRMTVFLVKIPIEPKLSAAEM